MSNNNNHDNQPPSTGQAGDTPPPLKAAKKQSKGKFDALTGWAKTVALYFDSNKIDCMTPEHYNKIAVTEANKDEALPSARLKDKMPKVKKAAEILASMQPWKEAKCPCELHACREAWKWNNPGVFQSEWVQEPNKFKGIGTWKQSAPMKRVMPVNFRLSDKQFEVLHERFPDWHFAVVGNGGHDHPISHVTTQVVTYEELSRCQGGKSYLDLHGNPTANERFTSSRTHGPTIDTYVSLASSKDFIRKKTKWGPAMRGEKRRYTEGPIISNRWHQSEAAAIADGRDGFLSFHTGYYYEPAEVLSVLKRSPDATFTMLMHRFPGKDGSLNNGELKYVKKEEVSGRVTVVQTNVETGESYSHGCNEHWFKRSAWTDVSALDAWAAGDDKETVRALSWTTNKVCDGVYKVTVVATPAYAAYLDEAVQAYTPPSDPVERYGGVDIKVGDSVEFIQLPGKAAALFDMVRKKMNHQRRTQDKFAAHVQTCAQKAEQFRVEKGLTLSARELSRIQIASFWVDFDSDAQFQSTISESAGWVVDRHASQLKGLNLSNKKNRNALVLTTVVAMLRAKDANDAAISLAHAASAMNGNT